MAIIDPGNLAPDALPRVRGAFLVRNWRGVWVAAKWPEKRGPPRTWNQYWTVKMFGYAGRMAANPEPMSYETARYFSEGSHYLPRDILTMAAYGKFMEVVFEDGTTSYQAYHGPPNPAPTPPSFTMSWQPNQLQGVIAAAADVGAFASKGAAITPDVPMTLHRMAMCLTPVAGATYVASCCTINGAGLISAVILGTPKTISTTTKKIFEFDISASLSANTTYAIMLTRTDGANNYALPVSPGTNADFFIPAAQPGRCRLASNMPVSGQTISVTGVPFCQSLLLDF